MDNYGVNDIKTLEGIEAVRLRPGVYIGSVGLDGIHHITLEIISNVVDEYLNGYCTTCQIAVSDDCVTIIDNGRGIPFGKAKDGTETLVNVFTKLHTGAKFDVNGNTGYNTSGGMNGLGAKATNALSKRFNVTVARDKKIAKARFAKGKLIDYGVENNPKGIETGTIIQFIPDDEIFKETTKLDYDRLRKQLQELAYLSPGLRFEFTFNDKPTEIIESKNGILDYIRDLNKNKTKLTSVFYAEKTEDRIGVKVAMLYNDSYSDTYKLYTNSIPNSGGTHLTGFRTALTQTINSYARENKLLKDKDGNIGGDELKEGLSLVLSFIMPDPVFSGQTKDVLSSSEARGTVQRLVSEELANWLKNNPKDAKVIVEKALLARKAKENARKAKDAVRNTKPKEKGLKAKMQLSTKFIDCAAKDPKSRNLLLVEGNSAATSAVEARDPQRDSIYMLRGKIISPLRTSVEKILANQEMSDIIQVIGAGFGNTFDISKCQFDKIVITSDADSDGEDIALLLTTFFFTYMRPLVEAGKLYRAITPLYICRKGKEEKYFWTEKEYSDFNTSGWSVLRAKG